MMKSENTSKKKRAFKTRFAKQFYLWHWVSGALCLSSMLLFAVTGITLNHAKDISAEPEVTEVEMMLPDHLLAEVAEDLEKTGQAVLPPSLSSFLSKELGLALKGKQAEWSEYEISLTMDGPGKDKWLLIDRESGEVIYQQTDRGVVSYLNDLHKGRNTGSAWAWFMDIFSVACIIFTITGIMLMWVHSKRRPSTWPIVIASLALPLLVIIIFVH